MNTIQIDYNTLFYDGNRLALHVKFNMVKQIAKGLQFLHQNQVLHRDFKSLNVLIDDNYNAKISDFGLSYSKNQKHVINNNKNTETAANSTSIDFAASKVDGAIGTYAWMAPELLINDEPLYTTKCDL